MATSRYPSTAMARGIARQRTPSPPSSRIRSTNGSRIIDRRNWPAWASAPQETNLTPPTGMPLPPPIYFGPDSDPWQQLSRYYDAKRIQWGAVANAGKTPLPRGALYPPGMPVPGSTGPTSVGGGMNGPYSGSF